MLSVFTVSAAVHEYVLSICFGYCYPVLFCLFTCFGSKFPGNSIWVGCGFCELWGFCSFVFWVFGGFFCCFFFKQECFAFLMPVILWALTHGTVSCPRVAIVGPNFVNGFLQPSSLIDICIHTVGLQAWDLDEQGMDGEEEREAAVHVTLYILK